MVDAKLFFIWFYSERVGTVDLGGGRGGRVDRDEVDL